MRRRIIGLICFSIFLSGCAQPADVANAQKYNLSGLSFDYPGNWKMTFNEVNRGARNIDIESNQSAMTYLIDLSREAVLTQEEFDQQYVDRYKKKVASEGAVVSVGKSVTVEAEIDGQTRQGTKNRLVVQVGDHQEIFHQIYYLYTHEQGMTIVIFQVADDDLKDTIKGFELIWSTLHKGIDKASI